LKRPDLRNRRTVLIGLATSAAILFAVGILAAFLSRDQTICPDGKPPIAQRSAVLNPTEYRCHDGRTVTK
jgi:hypothetical protein